jgi:type II secretory pathway component PulK
MKRYCRKMRSRKGMAMLMVLFIIMAIAVISSGFIARSDAELQCGQNYRLRNELDYLAWAGLEHAKALIIDPDDTTIRDNGLSQTDPLRLDESRSQYYDLTLNSPVETAAADPNDPSTYTYSIQSAAYDNSGGAVRARSVLDATLFYDPNSTEAYYISVTRP